MHKHIIIFGAGKSATRLIGYLIAACEHNNWRLTVADSNLAAAQSKTGTSEYAKAVEIEVENNSRRSSLIATGDLIISMLPPGLHYLVAVDCAEQGKHLLTASYLDQRIADLSPVIVQKGILFLCEMGLDPGIDHMSAMQRINAIQGQGGKVLSFMSHCGGLVAPECDDNPWHYKISWNPRSVVAAGSAGAQYREHRQIVKRSYQEVFSNCREVEIHGLGSLAIYPNRDSLTYLSLYGIEDAETFIRTTLRYPAYCEGWNCLVNAGLTNDHQPLPPGRLTLKEWAAAIMPYVTDKNRALFACLGLFDETPVPANVKTDADVLQHLLETRLNMQAHDRDMIVMQHEITYKKNGILYKQESTLVVTGANSIDTAMARTVGLPLGIAATLILQGKIQATGLHLPLIKDIYLPVLEELALQGIRFHEKETVIK